MKQPQKLQKAIDKWLILIGMYSFLLVLSLLFMGPFIFGLMSSFKDNANEWPPRLSSSQLKWRNWVGAYKMAKEGCGNGLFGELLPGHVVTMEVVYFYPGEEEITLPIVKIPRYKPRGSREDFVYAEDVVKIVSVEEVARKERENGTEVYYRIRFTNEGQVKVSILPVEIEVASSKIEYVGGTRDFNRSERRGRLKGWNNIVSGTIPYIFAQYHRVFTEQYSPTTGRKLFLIWIGNSFLYAFVRVVTTVLFAAMAGYALSKLEFVGRKLIFAVMLFSMMVPSQVTFISNYLVLRDGIWGFARLFGFQSLLNTYTGLVLSGLCGAASVFIMKQFFDSLPKELEECARIDGATTYQIFFRIMFPLAKPAMGAVTILTFQGAWNDFFWPLVILTSPIDKYPLTIGLKSFQNTYTSGAVDWGPILAGAFLSAIPVLVVFFVFQKYFVQGISFTGLKD